MSRRRTLLGDCVDPVCWRQALRKICTEHGILLVLDEVQAGLGRTGEWFAADLHGVAPDVVCLAMGIAHGLPLSVVAAPREIMSRWGPASHGTTYGGNSMARAAAIATLDVIREEGLLENARVQGAHIMDALLDLQAESPLIGDVRGVGLMIAVEFIKPNEVGPPALPTRSQTPRPSAGSWSAVWQMAC